MRTTVLMILGLATMVAARGAVPSQGEQDAARKVFSRMAASPAESVRLMAVRRLTDMDFPWRVELLHRLIVMELREQDRRQRGQRTIPRVALAAIDLVGSSRSPDSVEALVEVIVGEKRRNARTAMILSLGSIQLGVADDALPWERIEPALDRALAGTDDEELMAAIDAYAGLGRSDKLDLILARRIHASPIVRSAVIAAIAALFVKAAPRGLDELVEMLEDEVGALRLAAMLALTRTTGWDCRFDAECWRARIAALERGAELPRVEERFRTDTFFGLPLVSDRMLIVIDCSSSMTGWKWDRVVSELKTSLDTLEKHQSFDLMFFTSDAVNWRSELVVATRPSIQAAKKRLERQGPIRGGMTDLYGALEAAFSRAGRGIRTEKGGVGIDTIVLVSDGSPTVGEISLRTPQLDASGKPREDDRGKPIPISKKECYDRIANAVKAANAFRRVTLHVIGIGHPDEGLAESLLKRLAEDSGGIYRAVRR